MRLSDGCIKKEYIIIKLIGPESVIRRLCELGFISGEKVYLERKSILKGVFLIKIKNYLLAIKRKQLEGIEVANE